MSNQGDTSGWPLDMQLKWALRHGKNFEDLEKMIESKEPVALIENLGEKSNATDNTSVHDTVVEEQIDKLAQSFNKEMISLRNEFAISAQSTVLEEQLDKLAQSLNEEMVSLRSEVAVTIQSTVLEEKIDKLGKSLNEEMVSLRSEVAVTMQSTVLEEKIDKLGKSLNEEMVSLRSEVAVAIQSTVLEEKIDKLGKSLNEEMVSLRSEVTVAMQSNVLEEEIDKLTQALTREMFSLKSEFAIVAQGAVFEEQVDKLTKTFSQEILSLRNEFAMFVQAQLQQEKAWKLAETEWKNSLQDRETKVQANMEEMLHNILGKFVEHFQYADERLQQHDQMLRDEIALLTGQLISFQQSQDSKEEIFGIDWQKKMEERQISLVKDMDYIQYVLEEIATRPQSMEAQQKLREKFLIREMAVLKEKMESLCQACQVQDSGSMMAERDMTANSEMSLEKDKKHRRRR